MKKLAVGACPEQLRLLFYLWARDAVRELIEDRFGVRLALSTVRVYLKTWGFTPQEPVRRAFEQSPTAVKRWLEESYPTIAARAKQKKGAIYWGDKISLRSDYQAGRIYGLRGTTPVVRGTGQRFSVNMISAITNRGALDFMVSEESFRVKIFLTFLTRLIKQAKRKVFLVVDAHTVHRAKIV